MKNIIFALSGLALALLSGTGAAQSVDPVTDLHGDCGRVTKVSTYGNDNRREYCSGNMVIRDLADSVAGFFSDGSSVTLTGESYTYAAATLGERKRLAPDQRFASQPAAAFCTGFLVGKDLIATAGHCVKDHHAGAPAARKDHAGACQENLDQGDFCANIRVVFGFRKDLGGVIPRSAPARDVYKCVKVISHSLESGPDYALIKLDRKVAGLRPLAINRANAGLSMNTPLFVIGHPSGIPLKIAGDAAVMSGNDDVFVTDAYGTSSKWVDKGYSFLTNLDTFHGNSGSPVINLNTLLVEGILVAGDKDYEGHPGYPGRSRVTNYPQTPGPELGKGAGEVCTKISVPAPRIPRSEREKDTLKMKPADQNRIYPYLLKMLKKRADEERNYIVPNRLRQPREPVFS